MNTPAQYRHYTCRRTPAATDPSADLPTGQPIDEPDAESTTWSPDHLDADPGSRTDRSPLSGSVSGAPRPGTSLAWVRPTELASYVGPALGRGIEARADLIRRNTRPSTNASAPTGPDRRTAVDAPRSHNLKGPQL